VHLFFWQRLSFLNNKNEFQVFDKFQAEQFASARERKCVSPHGIAFIHEAFFAKWHASAAASVNFKSHSHM